jgi:hypothetical protein
MPAIPAAQFALVEPDFDAATTQGLADPLRRPRVLRGVAQKYSARWLRHGHLTPGPVRCRAGWDACGERHLPLCAQCYSVRQSGRQIAPFTFSPGSARTPQGCSLQREWPLSGKLQSHRGRLLLAGWRPMLRPRWQRISGSTSCRSLRDPSATEGSLHSARSESREETHARFKSQWQQEPSSPTALAATAGDQWALSSAPQTRP